MTGQAPVAPRRAKFGRVDALFVNAGIGKFIPQEVTEEFFDETMATNLNGAFFTVQKAVPPFSKGAAVVLNASVNPNCRPPRHPDTSPAGKNNRRTDESPGAP